MNNQASIDDNNKKFWDTPCGENAAISLGIHDASEESLKKFDDWFFSFYPYLYKHIPFQEMKGKHVLEVGLGYGTVAQKIAESGADYVGLDIANGPVNLVNHRMKQNGLNGKAVVGSILNAPFEDNSFDFVVAIGCYHHTGDLQRALDETYRILKPNGGAVVMIYYSYSYRLWFTSRKQTFKRFCWEHFHIGRNPEASIEERAQYDAHADQTTAAPETVFTSRKQFMAMTKKWQNVKIYGENVDPVGKFAKLFSRRKACKWFGNLCGLDIYCSLKK